MFYIGYSGFFMFNFGYGSYPVKITHCKIGFLTHSIFKPARMMCLRLLQIVPVMLNYFSISYIYVYIHLMFSCENISFVCVANSPTVHVNGYSFRFSFRKSAKKTIVVQDSYNLQFFYFIRCQSGKMGNHRNRHIF